MCDNDASLWFVWLRGALANNKANLKMPSSDNLAINFFFRNVFVNGREKALHASLFKRANEVWFFNHFLLFLGVFAVKQTEKFSFDSSWMVQWVVKASVDCELDKIFFFYWFELWLIMIAQCSCRCSLLNELTDDGGRWKIVTRLALTFQTTRYGAW